MLDIDFANGNAHIMKESVLDFSSKRSLQTLISL